MQVKRYSMFGIILSAVLLFLFFRSHHSSKNQIYKIRVEYKSVAKRKVSDNHVASGEVKANNIINISPGMEGNVEEVLVNSGSKVKSGDVLIRLSSRKLHEEDVKTKKATFEHFKSEFERQEKLFGKGSISKKDFLKAKTDMERAEGEYNIAVENLKKTEVVAPFDGSINAFFISKGDHIAPYSSRSSPIMTIVGSKVSGVRFDIIESHASKIKVGDDVIVEKSLDKDKSIFMASIDTIDMSIGNNQLVSVFAKFKDGESISLRPGSYVKVKYRTSKVFDAFVVPEKSIYTEESPKGKVSIIFMIDGKDIISQEVNLRIQDVDGVQGDVAVDLLDKGKDRDSIRVVLNSDIVRNHGFITKYSKRDTKNSYEYEFIEV